MNQIKLFEDVQIRSVWNEEEEQWYFSVVDVCHVLSESKSTNPGAYWRKLKQRLIAEGSEVVTKCHGLKMVASDGKMRLTDALNTDGILRLIQSIPSKKRNRLSCGWHKWGVNVSKRSQTPGARSNAYAKHTI